MDLRPAAVLEADAARIDELRRRRDSMAVATRIRMVDQPPEGLLPLSLFDRTPLPDRTALHPRTMETVAPDIAGLYVDYMTRIAMGAPKRVAFRIPVDPAVGFLQPPPERGVAVGRGPDYAGAHRLD